MNKILWVENDTKITSDDFLGYVNDYSSYQLNLPFFASFLSIIKDITVDKNFETITDLINFFENSKKAKFELHTSGSTGKPKLVKVILGNCLRNVKKVDNQDSWGLAYPPKSFAGTQVFFQALLNIQTIVLLHGLDFSQSSLMIKKYKITNLACTPTYLKLLTSQKAFLPNYLKNISLGGEVLTDAHFVFFKGKLPGIKIRNIYASTEVGSVLATNGQFFYIPEKLKKKVKIKNNELIFHKSLLNDFQSKKIINDWYHSGDIVKCNGDKYFSIVNRDNNYINIGGNKVNLIEIENIILKNENIQDVIVYSKPNSIMGNIIIAEYIGEIEPKDLRAEIKTEKFKIPSILKKVDNIELTNTGKKIRK